AVLEDADYRAQLLQAQADARGAEAREKRAEVDLQDAQRQFDREQIVQQKGVGTPAALDQVIARLGTSKATLAAAHADVAAAQARVEVARVNPENCYVRAPFSGRITLKLTFVDDAADVLPDMGSKVTFLTKELDEAAQKAAPTPAISPDTVVDRGETKAVFTVQSDRTVKAVPVVTGPPLGNLVSLRQ